MVSIHAQISIIIITLEAVSRYVEISDGDRSCGGKFLGVDRMRAMQFGWNDS